VRCASRPKSHNVRLTKEGVAKQKPTPSAKRKQTFMLFAYPTGVQGNVVSPGVNEFIIPNYKQTWAGIRKIADTPEGVRHLTFKSQEYSAG
jgi:arsenite oxidase large subunit